MTAALQSRAGTEAVRANHRFDEARLAEWMVTHVAGYVGPLTVTQFKGGQSNPTYRLDTPGHSYVMRRKPPGDLVKGAHAVDREYRVLEALGRTDFPVARVYGLCTDNDVIGTWFYIMDMVEGRSIWDTSFPNETPEHRRACFDAMNATIATLHATDYQAIGLGDYGKQGNYFQRQIDRWTRAYLSDDKAGRDPSMDRLIEWLPANIPPGDETTLIHGDFRCDNMIFHKTEPRVIAVLDWELSTLGHPLGDFAFHAMMYRMPPNITTGLLGVDVLSLNIPSEAEYIAQYCRRTGREGIADYDFYVAFNMFRLAAILHGIKGRWLRGNASSAQAGDMAAHVEPLAALAWQQAIKGQDFTA